MVSSPTSSWMLAGAVLGWTRTGSCRLSGWPAAVHAASARGLLGSSCRLRLSGQASRLAVPAVSPAPTTSQMMLRNATSNRWLWQQLMRRAQETADLTLQTQPYKPYRHRAKVQQQPYRSKANTDETIIEQPRFEVVFKNLPTAHEARQYRVQLMKPVAQISLQNPNASEQPWCTSGLHVKLINTRT